MQKSPQESTSQALEKYATKQPIHYSFDVAQWIAHEHALGDSLQALHDAHPDVVPAPLIIARWRREFPAFDLVMKEAEKARAAKLAEDVLTVSDNVRLPAAKTANKIRARQWLAAKLDPAKWGKQDGTVHPPREPDSGNGKRASLAQYSDDELQDIIRAHLQANSIDGESQRQDPGHPPAENSTGLEAKDGSATSKPKPYSQGDPVTYNDTDEQAVSQDGMQVPEF